MPLISVVVPTRNRPRSLAACLRSILNQTGIQCEVIVVDDGSSDPVLPPSDARVRVIRHASARGVSAARNSGITAARGTWVAFCDDDDLWAPDKLSAQVAAAAAVGAGWVYAGCVEVDDDLRILAGGPPLGPPQVMAALPSYNAVPGSASSVVVRAGLLAVVGHFDIGRVLAEDWDMWLRLAQHGPPAASPRPLVALRQRAANRALDAGLLLQELTCVARRHNVPVDIPRHLRWAAWRQLREGRRLDSARCYLRAMSYGDFRSLGRAAAAVLAPGLVATRQVVVDPQWVREAEAWLTDLRSLT